VVVVVVVVLVVVVVVVVVVVMVVGYKKTFLMFHKARFVSCALWLEVYCSSVSRP
jgi:uncharacterized membrane protein